MANDKYFDMVIHEIEQLLNEANKSLLLFGKDPRDAALVKELFRALHTIKSLSHSIGFEAIAEIAHRIEDVFSTIQKQKITMSEEIMDIVLKGIDIIQDMMTDVKEGKSLQRDTASYLKRLDAILNERERTHSISFSDSSQGAGPAMVSVHKKTTKEIIAETKNQTNLTDIFIKSEKLNTLCALAEELGVLEGRLKFLCIGYKDQALMHVLREIEKTKDAFREEVLQLRMISLSHMFGTFARMVKEFAIQEGKNIEFEVVGSDIELDKVIVEHILEPIVHLLRNAIDHGIEMPLERIEKGKSPQGHITLKMYKDVSSVYMEIADDGRGMDLEKIKTVALEKGLVDARTLNHFSKDDIISLATLAGFSTADHITDISGRGIGLDVVKETVERFGGDLHIITEKEKGSTFILKFPILTAMIQAMFISCEDTMYAIPMGVVRQVIQYLPNTVDAQEDPGSILFEQKRIPCIFLDTFFVAQRDKTKLTQEWKGCAPSLQGYVVVVEYNGIYRGFIVDTLSTVQNIVIRPLGTILKNIPFFSGATVYENGRLVLVLEAADFCKEGA